MTSRRWDEFSSKLFSLLFREDFKRSAFRSLINNQTAVACRLLCFTFTSMTNQTLSIFALARAARLAQSIAIFIHIFSSLRRFFSARFAFGSRKPTAYFHLCAKWMYRLAIRPCEREAKGWASQSASQRNNVLNIFGFPHLLVLRKPPPRRRLLLCTDNATSCDSFSCRNWCARARYNETFIRAGESLFGACAVEAFFALSLEFFIPLNLVHFALALSQKCHVNN